MEDRSFNREFPSSVRCSILHCQLHFYLHYFEILLINTWMDGWMDGWTTPQSTYVKVNVTNWPLTTAATECGVRAFFTRCSRCVELIARELPCKKNLCRIWHCWCGKLPITHLFNLAFKVNWQTPFAIRLHKCTDVDRVIGITHSVRQYGSRSLPLRQSAVCIWIETTKLIDLY